MLLTVRRIAALAVIVPIWAVTTGCAVTVPRADLDSSSLGDPEFLSYLADRPLVSTDEAYRAVLILADGQTGPDSFEQREAELMGRGIARAAWGLTPDRAVDKGAAAFMVMRACQIKGGLNCRLLGSWGLGDRRYALGELSFLGLLPEQAGADYEPIAGGELVGLLHKADEYMEQAGLYPALQSEMPPVSAATR
jgi:hypothetical protein